MATFFGEIITPISRVVDDEDEDSDGNTTERHVYI